MPIPPLVPEPAKIIKFSSRELFCIENTTLDSCDLRTDKSRAVFKILRAMLRPYFELPLVSRQSLEMLRFLAVVLVGLGLNTLLVWAFVYPLSMHPTVAKIAAVPIVLVWNYLGRRLLVFSNEVPVAVRAWMKPARLLPTGWREPGIRRQPSRTGSGTCSG